MTWIFVGWMFSRLFYLGIDSISNDPASGQWTIEGGARQPLATLDGGVGQPPKAMDGGVGQPPQVMDGGVGQPPAL